MNKNLLINWLRREIKKGRENCFKDRKLKHCRTCLMNLRVHKKVKARGGGGKWGGVRCYFGAVGRSEKQTNSTILEYILRREVNKKLRGKI